MNHLFFADTPTAEKALTEAGFSIGTTQRDAPRGLMLGDGVISKWRNLDGDERGELDGAVTRVAAGPGSPVKVFINHPVSAAAMQAFQSAAEAAETAA